MNDKPTTASKAALVALFLGVFLAVFLLVVITTTLVTFILPESYVSAARIRLDHPLAAQPGATNTTLPSPSLYDPYLIQTEFEIIQSEVVLRRVIENLDLNMEWGKKYAGGERLKTTESLALLKGRLELRPIRNTSLIEIRVFSEMPDEAAGIANAVVKSYATYATDSGRGVRVEVVDPAHPPLRPVRPNKPLNISLGVVIGLVLGCGCAGFAVWLALVFRRSGRAKSSEV